MISENKFNLIEEQWIPIADQGLVSLSNAFSVQTKNLTGTPLEIIAMFKFLLAISHRSLFLFDGDILQNDDDWNKLTNETLAEACQSYLKTHEDSFWLYGPKPFLQMPKAENAKARSFKSLRFETSGKTSTILTQIHQGKTLNDSEKALFLIVDMNFGLSGKRGDEKFHLLKTTPPSKGTTSIPNGPSLGGLGLLHVFLQGKTLLETMRMNLFTSQTIQNIGYTLNPPPWEKMPEKDDCPTAQDLKKSWMGLLMPLSRFVLLSQKNPDEIHYTEGLSYPRAQDGRLEPSICYKTNQSKKKKNQDEYNVLWADPNKNPLRNFDNLLGFIVVSTSSNYENHFIKNGLTRLRAKFDRFGLWMGGISITITAGEQSMKGDNDYVQSSFLILSNNLGADWYDELSFFLNFLEDCAKELKTAVQKYTKEIRNQTESVDIPSRSTTAFWHVVESRFQSVLNAIHRKHDPNSSNTLENQEKINQEKDFFVSMVEDIYNRDCDHQTARQLTSWAKNYPRINVLKESYRNRTSIENNKAAS